jgi:hypothetical protein
MVAMGRAAMGKRSAFGSPPGPTRSLVASSRMEQSERSQTPQTIAWLRDLYKRGLLNLDPPYQRRSVWNQAYKDYFLDTILLNYPAPPLFLHEEMSPDGIAAYAVVDGKQRLTTVFDFADDLFPVSESSALSQLQGKFFSQCEDGVRKTFFSYKFAVEFIPTTDQGFLNDIFDRLNRNVARLTRQELRRARFSGEFAGVAEELSDYMLETLPQGFPRIAASSRRQMKDVELVAQLLLLVEEGPSSFSQDQLDDAYSEREEEWEERQAVERGFRATIGKVEELASAQPYALHQSRLRNQADFYSFFGAVHNLRQERELPDPDEGAEALTSFLQVVGDDRARQRNEDAQTYFDAARSASNDLRQRRTRIRLLEDVLRSAQ